MSEIHMLSAILISSSSDPQLPETIGQYVRELGRLPVPWELIIVTVGDSRDTAATLRPTLEETDASSTIISLNRGGDESTQIMAGLEASRGDVVALLPEYLQSSPAALCPMLEAIRGGVDFVASWRSPRIDSKVDRFKSQVFNWLTRKATGVKLHDLNSGLRMIRRELIESVPVYGDLFRFWPILADRQGFRISEVKVQHLEERVRPGDYAFGVYVRRLLDVLTLFFLAKFTSRPLRFFGLLGAGTFALGFLVCLALAVQWLAGVALAARPSLILGVLCIVLGVQFVSLGLLGELIIFTHARALRHFHVEKVYERHQKKSLSEWTA